MAKRKDDATKIAEINFEPISAEMLEQLQSVSNEGWLNHLVTIRLAFEALSKSKEELKAVAAEILVDEELNPIEGFDKSIGFLSAGVEFLTAAKTRLLVAGVAIVEEARS
jgi:hypothetical protein